MKKIFLESHNLKNIYTGLGQYNYHLIKAMSALDLSGLEIILNVKKPDRWREEFGVTFKYNKYVDLTRHTIFRTKKRYNLWHCMNQNIKIEPFFNIPYVLTIHDIHSVREGTKEQQDKHRKLFASKIKRANAIVYISEFSKNDTHSQFNIPDIPQFVIYNGNTITNISIPENTNIPELPDQPYLFTIGAFSERKNLMSLLLMLSHLPQYHLILAGDNNTENGNKLKTEVKNLNLENRVSFPGKISDAVKKYYLKNCEAFVFPSLREGFGIPPIEAMRFGKPVFMSNSTSLPEVGGEHCFYWDHYEPKYMADVVINGMNKVEGNEKFYKDWYMARSKKFNWNDTAKQYLEVYKTVLKQFEN